jgi:hypothetical protein
MSGKTCPSGTAPGRQRVTRCRDRAAPLGGTGRGTGQPGANDNRLPAPRLAGPLAPHAVGRGLMRQVFHGSDRGFFHDHVQKPGVNNEKFT